MRILGIDPGYDRLGVAVLERIEGNDTVVFSTCIQTDKTQPIAERIFAAGTALEAILVAHSPVAVGLETLFFNKNVKTAIGVAEARGMILHVAQKAGCAIVELSPQEVKIAVTGYGKSDKRAVIDMTKRLVRNVPNDVLDDEYDAIAVGVATLAHHR